LAHLLAGAGAAGFICLALMYALEIGSVGRHVFGPLSDLGTPVWNLLLIPLLLTFYQVLKVTRFGQSADGCHRCLSHGGRGEQRAVGHQDSDLRHLDAGHRPWRAGPGSVVVRTDQAAEPGWPRWVVRLGLFIPAGQAIGAALVGISLGFGWGSVPQVAIMAIGLVASVPAWAAWPVWFLLVGRFLAGAAGLGVEPCVRLGNTTTSGHHDHRAGAWRSGVRLLASLVHPPRPQAAPELSRETVLNL
jgi:hypothetical protein